MAKQSTAADVCPTRVVKLVEDFLNLPTVSKWQLQSMMDLSHHCLLLPSVYHAEQDITLVLSILPIRYPNEL